MSALARTHTRVALCPVSRTQLGWVSAFNPLGGVRSLSRKACIHLRPRKAVGFVSGCNGLRTTTDQARTDGRTDGWTGLTAADYHLDQPTILPTHPTTYHIRFALLCRPVPLPGLSRVLLHRFQDKHPPRELFESTFSLSLFLFLSGRFTSVFLGSFSIVTFDRCNVFTVRLGNVYR